MDAWVRELQDMRCPTPVFGEGGSYGERLAQVNTSSHYTSKPLTADRVAELSKDKMIAFYKDRFANAADFTFFMTGTFKVDEALPLIARYVGSLPSSGARSSDFKDLGVKFPAANERAKVEALRPRCVAVLGLLAYRTAFRRPGATIGPQSELIATAPLWLLPNPSGLQARYQVSEMNEMFEALFEATATA